MKTQISITDTEMIDKIALMYIKGDKVLSSLSKGKEKYYFPSGKREAGETDLDC